jgi:hypothetical protein
MARREEAVLLVQVPTDRSEVARQGGVGVVVVARMEGAVTIALRLPILNRLCLRTEATMVRTTILPLLRKTTTHMPMDTVRPMLPLRHPLRRTGFHQVSPTVMINRIEVMKVRLS